MYRASYRWWNWKPPAGFRISLTDVIVIVMCAIATWGMWPVLGETAALLPIVLGHFFLFCNVFRVPRLPELLWSGAFVANVGGWLALGQFSWLLVLGVQSPVTLIVILAAVFQRDYHGVGYWLVPWGRRPENMNSLHSSRRDLPQMK
jgi:hypothetical protein